MVFDILHCTEQALLLSSNKHHLILELSTCQGRALRAPYIMPAVLTSTTLAVYIVADERVFLQSLYIKRADMTIDLSVPLTAVRVKKDDATTNDNDDNDNDDESDNDDNDGNDNANAEDANKDNVGE